MNKMRTCNECGKDFEQTFGGRPRKKCYECVPARLTTAGGQSHDAPGTKPGKHGRSASQKTQRQRPESTVGKHTGNSADAAVSSQVHCDWCGSYPPHGQRYCNIRHEQAAIARRQAGVSYRRKPRLYTITTITHTRPLDRVRQQEQMLRDELRSKAAAKARAKAAA
jgi:hypothetical protein